MNEDAQMLEFDDGKLKSGRDGAALRAGRKRQAGSLVNGINRDPTPHAGQVDPGLLDKAGEILSWLGQP